MKPDTPDDYAVVLDEMLRCITTDDPVLEHATARFMQLREQLRAELTRMRAELRDTKLLLADEQRQHIDEHRHSRELAAELTRALAVVEAAKEWMEWRERNRIQSASAHEAHLLAALTTYEGKQR